MKKIANIAAVTLCLSSAQAVAENSVEVMHFWTSGGEAAALGVIRDKVVDAGIE